MATPKVSPFAHELNYQGTACADDCPACRWVKLTTFKFPPVTGSEWFRFNNPGAPEERD